MKKLIVLALSVLLFTACQQHPVAASLSSKSPDGKTVINIDAKKVAALDPFTVTMSIKTGATDDGSLQFEIAASELNDSNVRFKWADSQNCTITFVQSDGGERAFAYYATTSNVLIKEIKNE
jgi:hypothetical protein